MSKKTNLILIIFVITFSVSFSYSLVFGAWDFFKNDKTSVYFKLSDNIYTDSLSLKKTKIIFKSDTDITNSKIYSNCNIYSKNIGKKWDLYLFDLKFLDNKCNSKYFYLKDEKQIVLLKIKLSLRNKYKIFSNFLDYKTDKLERFRNVLENKRSKLLKYKKYDNTSEINYYTFLKNNRLLNEITYIKNVINSIIEWRELKYSIPVKWYKLPNNYIKVPNSWRGYRADYTDGVHHGWDIDTKFWEEVVAIDDAIVVRVVSDFEFDDLNAIKKSKDLTQEEQVKNLDLLRGNQIWLKTMKWDVSFYSHLNEVYPNIRAWAIIKRWEPLWTVWITWIPDKAYNDFHLHFTIQKNPFIENKVWKYIYDDYMSWDWEFKWRSSDFILKNQYNIFEG